MSIEWHDNRDDDDTLMRRAAAPEDQFIDASVAIAALDGDKEADLLLNEFLPRWENGEKA